MQLQETYIKEILPKLKDQLQLSNVAAVPRMKKIVLNMGLKEALKDNKLIDEAVSILTVITGQKPVVTKAKIAIAGFKLRKGDPIGVMVTLRGKRMYDFFERLTKIVLPRVRDFHGVSITAFDGRGNYSLGFSEVSVFPEIDTNKIQRIYGMQLTVNTSARTDDQARELLRELGMPFQKEDKTKRIK